MKEEQNFIENSGFGAEFHQGEMGLSDIVLLRDAWKNNGKVEGWDRRMMLQKYTKDDGERSTTVDGAPEWKYHMHRMIDFICEGGTPEDFIKTL